MDRRSRWWIVLIGLGMLAYGGAIVWSLWPPRGALSRPEPVLLAILIAGVGACALVNEIKYQPEDRRPSFLWKATEPYMAAWSKLWRTKWLLWIYGTVAVVFVVSGALSSVLTAWLRSGEGSTMIYGEVERLTFFQRLLQSAWGSMPNWLGRVLMKFYPTIGRVRWDLVTDLALVCLALSLVPVLQRLRREPEYSRKVGFFSLCLAVLALGGVVSGVSSVIEIRGYPAQMRESANMMNSSGTAATQGSGKSVRITYPSGAFGGRRMGPTPAQMVMSAFSGIALTTILGAIMVGGILGSLVRDRKGESISKSSFTEDAVRYFEPLAGLMLICALPGLLSIVWWIPQLARYSYLNIFPVFLVSPALMFASFAVVVRKANCWEAAMQSLRLWKKAWWGTICLIATGAFFYAIVSAPAETLWRTSHNTWSNAALDVLFNVIGVAASVLILLAVWEFYQANVAQPEGVLQEEA